MELPPPLPPAEVRSQAQGRSQSVLTSWSLLSHIVERYGTIIGKRWSKKNVQQRKQILVTAWGNNMPACHRPDFDILKWKRTNHSFANKDDLRREALLWPYINLQDLSRQRLMMLFLLSRSRHHPEAFARADFEACHIGVVSRDIDLPFLNGHVIMFTGRRTAQNYGETHCLGGPS